MRRNKQAYEVEVRDNLKLINQCVFNKEKKADEFFETQLKNLNYKDVL